MLDKNTLPGPVDLTNCDRESIHLLGAIQPFGFLIATSQDWFITRVSDNVQAFLGSSPQALIGRRLDDVFCEKAVHDIRGQMQTAMFTSAVARIFAVDLLADGVRRDVAVHVCGETIIIDCEPSVTEPAASAGTLFGGMIARLQKARDIAAFYRTAAREMRGLTGFDRVMVYRFAHDESGEVIAESARSGIDSFLGLHYPASDIPRQARILYEKNWLRFIADIAAPNATIVPALDDNGKPIDLSLSTLRSVSPIHIEYLRNMGVAASMSVSILKDGKLWGLFACHHYQPHLISSERRMAAELFGQMFSLLMAAREREEDTRYEASARTLHDRLITMMASASSGLQGIGNNIEQIAELLTCDGIGAWIEDQPSMSGLTPTAEEFAGLVRFLNTRELRDVFSSYEIGALHEPAKDFVARAAGMLVVPLSRPARDYVVFFRKEVARTVSWAGNPAKILTQGPLGDRLTPRKSFELWNETVRGQSMPWTKADLSIAGGLRISLLEVVIRLTAITENERRRAHERQELLIAELNHRVRNILTLIRGVISQSKASALSVEEFASVVGGRIHALARAHDQITAETWGPSSFHGLLLAEAGAYLAGRAERVKLIGPDMLLEPHGFTTVALVIHELMTNSVKYGALSVASGGIDCTTRRDAIGQLHITWSEHGGPPVKPPARRGFGSTIIDRSIPFDLNGEARVEYALHGLQAELVIPAAYVQNAHMSEAPSVQMPSAPAAGAARMPQKILLVEDNMLIALDTEDVLRGLGVDEVRTAGNVAQALALLAAQAPDFAILDVNLGAETSFAVAQRLMDMNVPFVFVTGYGEQIAYPPAVSDVRKIVKPYTIEALRAVLTEAA